MERDVIDVEALAHDWAVSRREEEACWRSALDQAMSNLGRAQFDAGRPLRGSVLADSVAPQEAEMSSEPTTMTYAVADRVARITLNRPERGNGLTPTLIAELAACVEQADLDPAVHVILLAGNGKGFCGGYDLVASAEGMGDGDFGAGDAAAPRRGRAA